MTFRLLALALVLSGCTAGDPCLGLVCGACPDTFVARVTLEGGGTGVEADGVPCVADGSDFVCSVTPGVGMQTVLIQAPGFVTSTESVITAAPPPGCCTCSPLVTRSVTLRPDGTDAGVQDGGADLDAAGNDAAIVDAGPPGACDESLVEFHPSGGSLTPGQLCDDVFACPVDAADAARIMAAAPSFECAATSEGPCTGMHCVLRPRDLDAAEIAEICALTQLVPVPALSCHVYL